MLLEEGSADVGVEVEGGVGVDVFDSLLDRVGPISGRYTARRMRDNNKQVGSNSPLFRDARRVDGFYARRHRSQSKTCRAFLQKPLLKFRA